MKIVIQCAGGKNETPEGAGFRLSDKLVKFVAHPECAPSGDGCVYVQPDALRDGDQTWREYLLHYNKRCSKDNPCRLRPAYQLYEHPIYQELFCKFKKERFFILSAGWGLIRSDFLTPDYDITFSGGAKPCARRKELDSFSDFQCLPDDGDKIVFLGGKDYLPLFQRLTECLAGPKTVFYNTTSDLRLKPGFTGIKFETSRKTNWHYECAEKLIDGAIAP